MGEQPHLFLIDITYTADLETIEANLKDHRDYLTQGYKQGFLLASGPKTPRIGGVIIGSFASLQQAHTFANNDPFFMRNLAVHTITEFDPVLHSASLLSFFQQNN